MSVVYIEEIEQIKLDLKFCVVEEDENYPEQLVFQAFEQEKFTLGYLDYLTRFNVLKETGLWTKFQDQLTKDEYTIYVMPSAVGVLLKVSQYQQPLEIPGFQTAMNGLLPYQSYGLRKCLTSPGTFFWNYGTGTGKTLIIAAGAQELLQNQNAVDVVLVFGLRANKVNIARKIRETTTLTVRTINGLKKWREKEFDKRDANVYVLNYEKAHFDFEILKKRIEGQRVLFCFDEAQKILTGNKASKAMNELILSVKDPRVWPLSATVVDNNPERFWRALNFVQPNPLGTRTEFRRRYLKSQRAVRYGKSKWSKVQWIDEWDVEKLEEVRHRVAPWTHSVRKSDPGVREMFKSIKFMIEPVQMSDSDRKLYDTIRDSAKESYSTLDAVSRLQYFNVLRYLSNTAEALKFSQNKIAQMLVAEGIDLSSETSSKFESILDKVESIRGEGDQIVMFTHWTNLSLFPLSREMKKRKIKHVVHYGTGMSDKQRQEAQDSFKRDKEITVFLSSDAGAHGLNFQNARYVFNVEIPHSFDLLTQRNDRIDRVDSYLENLTTYGFVCEDTVEERIWQVNQRRRSLSESVQGTSENYDRSSMPENLENASEDEMHFLLFGDE